MLLLLGCLSVQLAEYHGDTKQEAIKVISLKSKYLEQNCLQLWMGIVPRLCFYVSQTGRQNASLVSSSIQEQAASLAAPTNTVQPLPPYPYE